MTESIFDHDRLDVYPLSIEYVSAAFDVSKSLSGLHPTHVINGSTQQNPFRGTSPEGNGKRSLKDRSRFLDIARGSALECVAIQDVLAATVGMDDQRHTELKRTLHRIVSRLTRLIARGDVVAEPPTEYNAGVEYKYEYRDAEYEYGRDEPERLRWTEDAEFSCLKWKVCRGISVNARSIRRLLGRERAADWPTTRATG